MIVERLAPKICGRAGTTGIGALATTGVASLFVVPIALRFVVEACISVDVSSTLIELSTFEREKVSLL